MISKIAQINLLISKGQNWQFISKSVILDSWFKQLFGDFEQKNLCFHSFSGNFSVCLFLTIFFTSLLLALGQFCAKSGECTDSIFLDTVAADDSMDCLNKCKSYDSCNYGTFMPDFNSCSFFQTCSRFETDLCPNCLTSHSKCSSSQCLMDGICLVSTLHTLMLQRLGGF